MRARVADRAETALGVALLPVCALAIALGAFGDARLETAGRVAASVAALLFAALAVARPRAARPALVFILAGGALALAAIPATFGDRLGSTPGPIATSTPRAISAPLAIPTPSAISTASATSTPIATPTATPSATPTATPAATPRATLSPAPTASPAPAPPSPTLTLVFDLARPCTVVLPASGESRAADPALAAALAQANLAEFDFLADASPLDRLRAAAAERLGAVWRDQAFECLYAAALVGYRTAGLVTDARARDQVMVQAVCVRPLGPDTWWVRSAESYPPALAPGRGARIVPTSTAQAYVVLRTGATYAIVAWQPVAVRECGS